MKSQFSFSNGEVRIIPVKPEVPPHATALEKFQNCKYKSPEQHTRKKRNCCNSWDVKGFLCLKEGYFPLGPQICSDCPYYEKK